MASNEDVLSSRTYEQPTGRCRFLTNTANVFEHNAWDDVVWDEEQEADAKKVTLEQASVLVDPDKQEKFDSEAGNYWDSFYGEHQNRFFKDRHWLFKEFPDLAPPGGHCAMCECTKGDNLVPAENGLQDTVIEQSSKMTLESANMVQHVRTCSCRPESAMKTLASTESDKSENENYPGENSSFRIFEVGCGAGNTVFPVLQTNNDPGLMMYCCDFSATAVDLVKNHSDYDPHRSHAFVCDITEDALPMPDDSLDIVILIFVLSAIHPKKMQSVINKLSRLLKPGGVLLFRDYGRYDMAQLRFKKGRCLSDNFYVRGDGTRVYFFTQDELKDMFMTAGLSEEQNLVDRRLQVNRGRKLKMYRVWIQCKYRKPYT